MDAPRKLHSTDTNVTSCNHDGNQSNKLSCSNKTSNEAAAVFTSHSKLPDVVHNMDQNSVPSCSSHRHDISVSKLNKTNVTSGNNSSSSHIEITPNCSVGLNIISNGIVSDDVEKKTQKSYMDCVGNYNMPSTSSNNFIGENISDKDETKESRKRPSSLKLNKSLAEDSSSDTDNDDYSLGSEDGCIYTYRGGQNFADLPSSFFSLDMGLSIERPIGPDLNNPQGAPANLRDAGSRASSPDMDYLEMDFDPGPSCDADSGDGSSPEIEMNAANNMVQEYDPVLRSISPEYSTAASHIPNDFSRPPSHLNQEYNSHDLPSTSHGATSSQSNNVIECSNMLAYGTYITHVNVKGQQIMVRRTMSHLAASVPVSQHVSSGDLVSPKEMLNYEEDPESAFAHQINQGEMPGYSSNTLSSSFYHLTMVKKMLAEQNSSDMVSSEHVLSTCNSERDANASLHTAGASESPWKECAEPPRCMVWTEQEACAVQVTQIGTSACGATAIVNVFNALGVPVSIEKINSAVGTRQRANNAPLPRYLLSRAMAGCTAADLITGIHKASDGLVSARFFPTHPERAMSLSHWLADWMSLGAIPILTLNLQVGCDGDIPDAWHHQMVFGVSARGIYLCNPVECVRESILWPRLTSPSELLVKTKDVVSRFNPNTDLTPLMVVPDRRFNTYNVLGQVVNVIRESQTSGATEDLPRTRHVRIPASYRAGITLSVMTGSDAHHRLLQAPSLPLLHVQQR